MLRAIICLLNVVTKQVMLINKHKIKQFNDENVFLTLQTTTVGVRVKSKKKLKLKLQCLLVRKVIDHED